MAFPAEIIRSGVSIADDLTSGVQPSFTHHPWIGQDGAGKRTYGSPVTLAGVVDRTFRMITSNGQQIAIAATITVVGDISPNGAAGRREPIDPRDKIVLSDGFTGPIIDAPGSVVDPGTGRGFIHSIMLGAR